VGKPKIWENLPKTEWIDPGLVICDAGTQTRCSEISELTVDNYCDRMNEGEWDFEREPLPRLIYDGKNYYPITGHHRVRAAQKARLHIYASIKLGTLEDAIYEAVRDNSNANHGLPENSRDRRHRINAFFEMFESWTDDKRQEELDKIDCFPVGKNKQKFDSWSSRSIACYLRIPASYKQVQDIQAEREQVKKYRLVLEALEIGKWYQWHNGEQVCVGKLISKSDTSFGFEHPSDTIFEWQESISSFLNSVKEIQPDDNIPVDEDEENENQDDAKKNQPTYLDRQRVSYSLKVKCRQVANLETYSNSDIAGLCEVLGDWAKINGHDGFAKGILTFAERLSSLLLLL
ncbi:hypothetical protein, partial [Planktothrix sp.]|uniref:hypothetical protein n=1 Tax=Planktothrix sp. TaxID=3088171 RepID=UPI0038D3FEBD